MNNAAMVIESGHPVDRRTFFKKFARVSGVVAAVTSCCAIKPTGAEAFPFFKSRSNPRWEPLVSALKEYIIRTYIEHDEAKAYSAVRLLKNYGVNENELVPLQNVNRSLMPKNMFLAYSYLESFPLVKLFLIAKLDTFNGFMVDGKRRTTLFGKEIGDYRRVLLGKEIFSTIDAPPVALAYNLAGSDSSTPSWIIAVPWGWIHELYGNHSPAIRERLIEELTVHEITHIVHSTRDELLPFLAQFAYKMDDDRPIVRIQDLINYLITRPLTYHQAERLILERICYSDAYYGESCNSAHIMALKQIKDGLSAITEEINGRCPQFPRNVMKISDQQCHASMTLLYNRAVRQLAFLGGPPSLST